jgi:phosphate transport system substrate-binding protein
LINGKCDLIFSVPLSEEQVKQAADKGMELEMTAVAAEGFVFVVNAKNPVDTLTQQQLRDIYSGKITNWKEVGGEDKPIEAFQRNEGSGSQSMMLRFMGDTTMIDPEIKEIKGMGAIIEEVADYRNLSGSIGFSFRFYIEGMIKNPDIKMIAVDGVAPTVENIKSGAYPIIAPVYAVTYEGNDNPNVQRLLDWILSDEGQYIIEKTGYVGN